MKSLIKNSTNFFPLSFEQEQFLSKEEVKCVNEFNNISDQFLVQTIAAQSFNHFLIHALKIMIYLTFNCLIGF